MICEKCKCEIVEPLLGCPAFHASKSPVALQRLVKRRGRRGRLKPGWKKPLAATTVIGEVWVELFLPPAFNGDVMAVRRLNISKYKDQHEWNWWREQYQGLKAA